MPATRYLLYLAMGAFGIAVWMHFYAVVAVLPILFHMLFQHIVFGYLEYGDSRGFDRGFFLASGIFAICVVPFLTIGPALFGRRTGMGVVWGADPLMMVTDIFVEMAGFHILFALLFILLAVVGMRRYLDPSFAAFVPLTIIVPLSISAILAPHMDLSVRYLIFLIPVFYTLVGTGIVDVIDRLHGSPLPLLCIVGLFIVLINAPTLANYYTNYTKIDYRGAATYLTDATNDGDTVVLIPQSRESAFTFYYKNVTDNTRYLPLQFGTEVERLNEIVQMPGTIWLVLADVRECLDPDAPINRWLADRGITRSRPISGSASIRCREDPADHHRGRHAFHDPERDGRQQLGHRQLRCSRIPYFLHHQRSPAFPRPYAGLLCPSHGGRSEDRHGAMRLCPDHPTGHRRRLRRDYLRSIRSPDLRRYGHCSCSVFAVSRMRGDGGCGPVTITFLVIDSNLNKYGINTGCVDLHTNYIEVSHN
jgi:hypothetical protein